MKGATGKDHGGKGRHAAFKLVVICIRLFAFLLDQCSQRRQRQFAEWKWQVDQTEVFHAGAFGEGRPLDAQPDDHPNYRASFIGYQDITIDTMDP